ncbi:MAG: amidohydrolase [Christensenellales bacterium]
MSPEQMKQAVCAAIDEKRDEIIEIGRTIFQNPELGFKEWKTSSLVEDVFTKLGLSFVKGLAITGVKARLKGAKPGPSVAVLGELDAVVCPGHPFADPETGAAHSCGHNAQIASMLGAAMGLILSGVGEKLDGDAVFFAVPAEEFVEIEYREALREKGLISFLGGKQELIASGHFDDVDMAMMVHAQSNSPEAAAYFSPSSSAFIGKSVVFSGKEAHAGGAPFLGINALNAATAALMLIHAQRETFKDEDGIRVHPIITKGGDLVNIVPADVRMETYVRGSTMDAVIDANRKVNRAIKGAAYAIGADVDIRESPGYLPLSQSTAMEELYVQNIAGFVGPKNIIRRFDMGGSTDMGDISAIMPAIHPSMGGVSGSAHSKEYTIANEEALYIYPAKTMAMTVVDLLSGGAERAKAICESFSPAFSRSGYVQFWQDVIKGERDGALV